MYESLTKFENIYQAYRQSARGKHHKKEVIQYETNLHMQLWYLQQRLENRSYVPGGYYRFVIYEPKEREIQALSFADRVFQHLLCDTVLRQYFEPRLIYDNAAGQRNTFRIKKEGTKTLGEITQSLNSYQGHLKHRHTWKLRKHVYKNFVLSRHKPNPAGAFG